MDNLTGSVKPSHAAEAVRDNFRELVVILDRELAKGTGTAPEALVTIRKVREAAQRGLELTDQLVRALGVEP